MVAPEDPSITGRLRAELEGLAYREARARTRAEAAERAREESEDKARRDLELSRAEAAERLKAVEDELGDAPRSFAPSWRRWLTAKPRHGPERRRLSARGRTLKTTLAGTWSSRGPRRRNA